jgi:uncharacterized NAD(P)/FAD-binding protein YdhS
MDVSTVSIVGGGACCVAAFAELIVHLKIAEKHTSTHIQIIEKRGEVGLGLAFSTEQPGHLLNTQADLMGIHSFEPEHFAAWLKNNKDDVVQEVRGAAPMEESHTTRRIYGRYLQEQFNHYLREARTIGMTVEIIHDEVIDLVPENDRWQIQLAKGPTRSVDHVILVPGTPKPNNFPEFDSLDNYFGFPWPSEPILKRIPRDADVCVLGSSLSAIDVVMTLTDSGHQGRIRLFSPDGLMPRVQPKKEAEYERKFLTLSCIHRIRRTAWRHPTVKDLFRLFQQEVENYVGHPIDWKTTERKGIPAHHLLAEDINIAEQGGDAFTNILYGLRYETSQIWEWLSVPEKQRFKQWLGPYWQVTRHGMPLVNAYRLKELFETGKLEVNSPLHQVTHDRDKNMFILQYGEKHTEGEFLINATGPASEVEEMKSTLLQNLLKSGVIEAYPVGGINIDPDDMHVISSQNPHKNLYAVGHISNGVLLDVNAVWFNVRSIAKLCKVITKKIKNGNLS